MSIHLQFRRGLAATWTAVNPILAEGEPGLETDTGKFKIGDGINHWTALGYANPSVGGISAINISAGATSNNLSAVTFSNLNGVSFGLTGSVVTGSVATNYAGTVGGMTGGSITVDTNGVLVSLPPYLTTAMQSNAVTLSNAKISAGTLSALRSDLSFNDSNGVSFGLNTNGVLTATVQTNYQSAGAYLTTAALSGDSSKYAGTNGALTGGSITLNTSGLSINLPAYLTTAMASNAATISNVNVSAGTTSNNLSAITFSNSNGVSFGLSGSVVTATVATNYQSAGAYLTTAMQSNAATISNVKVSAGTLSANRSDLTFSNSNGVSFGLDTNGVVTATVATNYQASGAYLTTAALSGDTSKYAGVNGAITGGSITVNTSGVSVNLPAYLTTADLSANSSKYIQEWALTGNTSGTTSSAQGSRLYMSGGQGLTISGSSNSLVFSVGSYITTAGLSGDSSKYAGVNGAITGGSITVNTSGVSVNLPAYLTTAMLSNAATISNINVSAGSTSNNLSAVTFSNSNGYSFGLNGSTVTAQGPYLGWLEPYPASNTALFGPGAGSWYLAPFTADGSVSGGRINFLMQNTSTANLFRDFTEASCVSSSTGGQQQGYTYSLAAAIFSQGSGTNSTRLESVWSNSFSLGWTKSVSVSVSHASNINITVAHTLSYIGDVGSNGAYTLTSYVNSTVSSVANSSTASNFADTVFSSGRNLVSGSVVYPVGLNTTLSAGNYWLGFAWSSTRSNASTGTRISTALDFSQSSIVGISRLELNSLYRNFGSTATTARSALIPYGLYTAAANMAPPANIALSSDLSSLASQWVPYFNIVHNGLTK